MALRRDIAGLVWFAVACAAFALLAHKYYGYSDFGTFHADASDWLRTGVLYPNASQGMVNLNLPHVAVLFAPLAGLPLAAAWTVWQLTQIALACDILRRVASETGYVVTPECALALAVMPATLAQLAMGQLGWVLAWLLTMAWLQRHRCFSRGVWLGLAIALKPLALLPLAWWMLRREWTSAAASALVMALISGVGLVVLGLDSYVAWFHRVEGITWAHFPLNWSLWGLWVRLVSEGPRLWHVAIIAIVLGLTLGRLGKSSLDRPSGWVLSLTSALLLSPLGWAYYGWILIGPLAAWYPTAPRATALCLALLWVPVTLVPEVPLNTLGLIGIAILSALPDRAPRSHNLGPSSSRKGNCSDNVVAASFFDSMKERSKKQPARPETGVE